MEDEEQPVAAMIVEPMRAPIRILELEGWSSRQDAHFAGGCITRSVSFEVPSP